MLGYGNLLLCFSYQPTLSQQYFLHDQSNRSHHAYISRSIERALDIISTLIKSKIEAGINASNVVEPLALQQKLDLVRPRPYGAESFWNCSSDALYSCLQQFYCHTLNGEESRPPVDINIDIAARVWINSTVYSSLFYRNYRQEFRRSNHIVKFYGYNNKKFIGFIQFLFRHIHNGVERFLFLLK
ncbi:hypothetical protein BCV72DRAFT_310331 [Rhizopus microsporus var. microsporus]|uniref:Uncharacterized protein n=2 Tax=Rhizopus microsporus TaxID=58291 RepID=A0A2G4SX23_RHIZD|nr:uncharacterized protein RHIMIDRAFT_291773 [Rhizopus microsporus ATCC 52813]ORE01113.1 hypothetical protein BCV72DRAFT_310331 [Rhizopus microsporus var. microsporus]PHZ13294.1 hypothetical protein RHIMIDRAFT_291773 [Rhizopus microsporus ATCC 52813]